MQVSLRNPSGPVDCVKIAKDGADLPTHVSTSARETITVGETFEVEFLSPTAQDLILDLLLPGRKIHTSQTLSLNRASEFEVMATRPQRHLGEGLLRV